MTQHASFTGAVAVTFNKLCLSFPLYFHQWFCEQICVAASVLRFPACYWDKDLTFLCQVIQ